MARHRATRYLAGLASIYLLDPLATGEFMDGIGRSYVVWGGAIRTYLPDVDPAVAEEALRHRVLTGARILADPGRAAGILSVLPRRLATDDAAASCPSAMASGPSSPAKVPLYGYAGRAASSHGQSA